MGGEGVMPCEQDHERNTPQRGRDDHWRELVRLQRRRVGTAWGGHEQQAIAVRQEGFSLPQLMS